MGTARYKTYEVSAVLALLITVFCMCCLSGCNTLGGYGKGERMCMSFRVHSDQSGDMALSLMVSDDTYSKIKYLNKQAQSEFTKVYDRNNNMNSIKAWEIRREYRFNDFNGMVEMLKAVKDEYKILDISVEKSVAFDELNDELDGIEGLSLTFQLESDREIQNCVCKMLNCSIDTIQRLGIAKGNLITFDFYGQFPYAYGVTKVTEIEKGGVSGMEGMEGMESSLSGNTNGVVKFSVKSNEVNARNICVFGSIGKQGEERDNRGREKAKESELFKKVRAFPKGRYTDIAESSKYLDDIEYVYELGLMDGYSENRFEPHKELSIAQGLKIAATIHAKYYNNKIEALKKTGSSESQKWYVSYLNYCISHGILTPGGWFKWGYNIGLDLDREIRKPISRAEFALLLSKTFPSSEYIGYVDLIPYSFKDIKGLSVEMESAIEKLRIANITGGYLDGTFKPENNITRAQASVFVSKLVYMEMLNVMA